MPNPLLCLFACFTLLCSLAACSSSPGEQQPVRVIDFTDAGTGGACVQPSFPSEQPDLLIFDPPYFLLTTSQAQQSSVGQAIVRPGDPVEARISVNSPTRRVRVELTSVWDSRRVIATEEFETNGNEALAVVIQPDVATRGRYYMRLTMCGTDCDTQQVVFETQPCDGLPDSECAHNVPYIRSVVEENEIVRTNPTCIDLGSEPDIGSGSVLIQ